MAYAMKYGRLVLAVIGAALIVTGIVIALVGPDGVGLGLVVIGLVAVVLGVVYWREFEAQWSRLKLRVEHESSTPIEPAAADVRILRIEPTGGGDGYVDFRVELANYGTRRAEVTVTAAVDGTTVPIGTRHVSAPREPGARFDLVPNAPVDRARVVVPRPELGDLMLPEIPSEPTTLYDRTLEVVATWAGGEVTEFWHEPVFDESEDRARAAVQQRYWRRGRGEETSDDLRADALEAHERRVEGRE